MVEEELNRVNKEITEIVLKRIGEILWRTERRVKLLMRFA
mgnify:CR=1 FL=1